MAMNIAKAQSRQKENYDKRHTAKSNEIAQGSLVLLKTKIIIEWEVNQNQSTQALMKFFPYKEKDVQNSKISQQAKN